MPDNHDHVGRNVAMMIVGGAVLVVGAVIGGTPGTIIMVGGGVIGLIGLYPLPPVDNARERSERKRSISTGSALRRSWEPV